MTVHPVDQTNIVPGSEVSYSVTVTGTAPLSYQWQKNGVDLTDGGSITGATTATLTITGVMESDEGGYRCMVINIAGIVTSDTATLTVGKDFIAAGTIYLFSSFVWRFRVSGHCGQCNFEFIMGEYLPVECLMFSHYHFIENYIGHNVYSLFS